jgi:hypothetical protein
MLITFAFYVCEGVLVSHLVRMAGANVRAHVDRCNETTLNWSVG